MLTLRESARFRARTARIEFGTMPAPGISFLARAGLLIAAAVLAGGGGPAPPSPSSSTRYEDLLALFREWRSFQRPRRVQGVPDYGAAAMEGERRGLEGYRRRLEAI